MQKTSVSSSNLRSIGYNNATSTLEVEFLNGGVYQYSNVPEDIYNGLMSASSHGSYFYKYIKSADYVYEKIN